MARNNFLLIFEVDVWKKKKKEERQWIELEVNPQAVIFKLISCAHYFKTYSTGLGFLARLFCSEMLWSLKSIVFSLYRFLSKYSCYHLECATGIKPLFWVFNLPTLWKYNIPDEIICAISFGIELQIWGQLTHIDVRLQTTLSEWRVFVCGLQLHHIITTYKPILYSTLTTEVLMLLR